MFYRQRALGNQGAAAVIAADLVQLESRIVLLTVIEVKIKGIFASISGFIPPLPSRSDILEVDVCPLVVVRDLAIHKVLHTVAGIEVGGKVGSVNYRTLGNKGRHARPGLVFTMDRANTIGFSSGGIICGLIGIGVGIQNLAEKFSTFFFRIVGSRFVKEGYSLHDIITAIGIVRLIAGTGPPGTLTSNHILLIVGISAAVLAIGVISGVSENLFVQVSPCSFTA